MQKLLKVNDFIELQIVNVSKQKYIGYQMKILIEMNQMVYTCVLVRLQHREINQSRFNNFLGDHSPNMGTPSGHISLNNRH